MPESYPSPPGAQGRACEHNSLRGAAKTGGQEHEMGAVLNSEMGDDHPIGQANDGRISLCAWTTRKDQFLTCQRVSGTLWVCGDEFIWRIVDIGLLAKFAIDNGAERRNKSVRREAAAE